MLDLAAIFIGAIIGFSSAVVGALIDYRVMKRRNPAQENQAPGCIFIMTGSLGCLGVIVVSISFLLQSVGRALNAGVGVVAGFLVGFLIMLGIGFLLDRS